jgi:hypothetical protein
MRDAMRLRPLDQVLAQRRFLIGCARDAAQGGKVRPYRAGLQIPHYG